MSAAAASGGSGSGRGDDEKRMEELFNKLVDQLIMSADECDDEDVDNMNISSAEEHDPTMGHGSKKRGKSPCFIAKSKPCKKPPTDSAINKSKEMAKKEQPQLNKMRRKKFARERRKSLSSSAGASAPPDKLMVEAAKDDGKDDDTGGMADDSKTEEDGSESDDDELDRIHRC